MSGPREVWAGPEGGDVSTPVMLGEHSEASIVQTISFQTARWALAENRFAADDDYTIDQAQIEELGPYGGASLDEKLLDADVTQMIEQGGEVSSIIPFGQGDSSPLLLGVDLKGLATIVENLGLLWRAQVPIEDDA